MKAGRLLLSLLLAGCSHHDHDDKSEPGTVIPAPLPVPGFQHETQGLVTDPCLWQRDFVAAYQAKYLAAYPLVSGDCKVASNTSTYSFRIGTIDLTGILKSRGERHWGWIDSVSPDYDVFLPKIPLDRSYYEAEVAKFPDPSFALIGASFYAAIE